MTMTIQKLEIRPEFSNVGPNKVDAPDSVLPYDITKLLNLILNYQYQWTPFACNIIKHTNTVIACQPSVRHVWHLWGKKLQERHLSKSSLVEFCLSITKCV